MSPPEPSSDPQIACNEFVPDQAGQHDVVKTPQQLSDELGPFAPPENFEHGAEFASDPPRPILTFLRKGSFSRRRRGAAIVFAVLGSNFVLVAPWAIIHKLSFYVLPLAYLGQVGYGMIVISLFILIRNRLSKHKFEYVISGTPFVGRVLAIGHHLTRTINKETKQVTVQAQFVVTLEYDDPETRVHQFGAVLSEEIWNVSESPKYALSIEPGDYVTLVGMPGKIPETLRLYGLMGLDPQREYLTYRGKPLTGTSPLTAVLIAALVFVGLWMFVGFLYLINYCFPSEWRWPLGLTALGIGGSIGAVLGWVMVNSKERTENTLSPLLSAGLFSLPGMFAGIICLGLLNAMFDRSAPVYRPISIQNHWQTTHNGVFREYEIEFTEFGKAKSEKEHVSIEDLARLGKSKLAAKEIGAGALGLEWVRGVHAFHWIPLPENADPRDEQNAVTVDAKKLLLAELSRMGMNLGEGKLEFLDAKESKQIKVIPVLLLRDGSYVTAPDELVARGKQELANEMQ